MDNSDDRERVWLDPPTLDSLGDRKSVELIHYDEKEWERICTQREKVAVRAADKYGIEYYAFKVPENDISECVAPVEFYTKLDHHPRCISNDCSFHHVMYIGYSIAEDCLAPECCCTQVPIEDVKLENIPIQDLIIYDRIITYSELARTDVMHGMDAFDTKLQNKINGIVRFNNLTTFSPAERLVMAYGVHQLAILFGSHLAHDHLENGPSMNFTKWIKSAAFKNHQVVFENCGQHRMLQAYCKYVVSKNMIVARNQFTFVHHHRMLEYELFIRAGGLYGVLRHLNYMADTVSDHPDDIQRFYDVVQFGVDVTNVLCMQLCAKWKDAMSNCVKRWVTNRINTIAIELYVSNDLFIELDDVADDLTKLIANTSSVAMDPLKQTSLVSVVHVTCMSRFIAPFRRHQFRDTHPCLFSRDYVDMCLRHVSGDAEMMFTNAKRIYMQSVLELIIDHTDLLPDLAMIVHDYAYPAKTISL